MISIQAYLGASHSKDPLQIELRINHGNGRPFDVIYINDFSMHLNRAQTMQLQAELTRFIAAVQSTEPEGPTPEGSQGGKESTVSSTDNSSFPDSQNGG